MAGAAAAGLAAAAVFFGFTSPENKPKAPVQVEGRDMFSFVRSLEGTFPDGKLNTQGDALVVDAGLVRMFDYYLSAIGEQPLDAIRVEIEREIDRRLQGRAAEQAKHFLGRYLDYKRALVDAEKDAQNAGNSIAAIRARMAALREVRARFFSEQESQAIFGLSDADDEDAVARLAISQDATLDDAQKREKLAALDAALPEALRKAREEPVKVLKLEETVAKKRAEGASDDDIYRYRAAAFNPEAAARFADLDREEAAWKARIASYLSQRNQVVATAVSEADKQAQIDQLRRSLFTPAEQKRLPAYE
jgi:lipase chaperone LimK